MSCTLMYQPYAMSYSSSCDRPSASDRQKLFKFPHVPSPPDSSHSSASSYSGHSSSCTPSSSLHLPLGTTPTPNSSTSSSLSLSSPSPLSLHSHHAPHHLPHHHHFSPGNRGSSHQTATPTSHLHSRRPLVSPSGPSATITSAAAAAAAQGRSPGSSDRSDYLHSNHTHQHQQQQQHQRSSSASSSAPAAASSSSSTQQSSSQNLSNSHNPQQSHGDFSSNNKDSHRTEGESSSSGPQESSSGSGSGGPGGMRAQYLSANCVVYENYDGDSSRVVDEHFSRALSSPYASSSHEKPSKGSSLPMSTRNFPPSFWNSAYQPPPKHFGASYGGTGGAGDFYGSAMDYGSALAAHHHGSDPWHYPLGPHHHHHHHQSYHHHHRAAELAYPPMPSTSRFAPAQYGSFLFPGAAAAAASSAAGRFGGLPGPSQVGVKGETGHWGAGGRYHPHESTWPDFHLADYSAAAAHYSNMTAAAGLDFESHYLQSS